MKLLRSLNVKALPVDIAISVLYLIIFILYYEVVKIPFISQYLVSTPPQFLFIPLFLLIVYRLIRKETVDLYLFIFAFFFIWTFYIAGNHDQFRNTIFRYSEQTQAARICSWNTAYFFDTNKDLGFKALKDQKCDIILLQEVWKSEDQLQTIAEMRSKYLPGFDIRNYEEFVLFIPPGSDTSLSKSPTLGYLGVDLTFKKKQLAIYNVHLWNPLVLRPTLLNGKLAYETPQKVRADQEKDLLNTLRMKAESSEVIVVAGDFNSMQNKSILRQVGQIGKSEKQLSLIGTTVFQKRNTYPAGWPFIQIDYAFISQVARPKATKHLVCVPEAADHCLIVLDVLL